MRSGTGGDFVIDLLPEVRGNVNSFEFEHVQWGTPPPRVGDGSETQEGGPPPRVKSEQTFQ